MYYPNSTKIRGNGIVGVFTLVLPNSHPLSEEITQAWGEARELVHFTDWVVDWDLEWTIEPQGDICYAYVVVKNYEYCAEVFPIPTMSGTDKKCCGKEIAELLKV